MLDKSSTDDQLLDAFKEEITKLKAQQLQQQQQFQSASKANAGFGSSSSSVGGISTMSTFRTGGGAGGAGADNKRVRQRDDASTAAETMGGGSIVNVALMQEQWEAERQQTQAELQRLRRLCKNQVGDIIVFLESFFLSANIYSHYLFFNCTVQMFNK